MLPNGLRYPLVGGTRERQFDRTDLKPRKRPENAQTPTSRMHLGRMWTSYFTKETEAHEEYTVNWQTNKPYFSIGESMRLPWCTVVSDHNDPSTGGVLDDPD